TPGFQRAPARGTIVRIRPPDISVTDAARARRLGQAPAVMRRARHGWFWKIHSPTLAAAVPDRVGVSLASIAAERARGRKMISPEQVHGISARWGAQITNAARMANLSEALLLAVITVESGGRADAL